jgi:SAM-dependent methyltransferase
MVWPAISSRVWGHVSCSSCGLLLHDAGTTATCPGCGIEYSSTPAGALDLRLKRPKRYTLEFEVGTPLLPHDDFPFIPLVANSRPEVDFGTSTLPPRMTRELLSYFPKARGPGSLMLDLACGDAIHKEVAEVAGFEWVGIDYLETSKAPILADAHALPFKDESFEFILSVSALQLMRYPFVMMREAFRVLKPNGVFVGTVSFLEPFHDQGYYHHTHLGAFNSLSYGGFTVEKLAPSEDWSVLMAQASMGLFPRLPAPVGRAVVYPVHLLHKLWWRLGRLVNPKATDETRILHTTGAFSFVASKPAGTVPQGASR